MKRKRRKMMFRSNLDEMQEQKLLHIEARGFWLMYLLVACDLIIKVLTGNTKEKNLVEFFGFLVVCIYLVGSCVKNGIWDRRLKANAKTNVIVSIIAGVIVLLVNTITYSRNTDGNASWQELVGVGGFSGLFTMLLTLLLLCIGTACYQHRLHVLEEEPEESEEEK